ncbi:MAG TPA: double-strand break repair protein AddB [Paracoccaceae bacterium]|nr:double-strand break repair protein AddB [Paracoccaceae bacterium]
MAEARLFALPPGADFAALFVQGLRARLLSLSPETVARTRVWLNSARMRARVVQMMTAQGDGLLPRIGLVTDIGRDLVLPGLPPPVPPVQRRLELAVLIARLLDRQPGLAPRDALYDLADSLAALIDEMQGEGVAPGTVAALDVSQHSAHWQRTRDFMAIAARFFGPGCPPEAEARQRVAVARLAEGWATSPPDAPVIVAGSTGSRGTTLALMQAVAGLPQGAVVLPGLDPHLGADVWGRLRDPLTAEDHPQFRLARVLHLLGAAPAEVPAWVPAAAPDPARNRLVSLALRPAPVTDRWLAEGPALGDLAAATTGLTLIEAPDPRAEALAIAAILREVAEDGARIAALVTPDRELGRRVTAALDRWGIRPDDSAGQPLSLTPPGRLVRMAAALSEGRPDATALLAVLNHPLVGGADRGLHLRLTRALELRLRDRGPPYPSPASIRAFAVGHDDAAATEWAEWVAGWLAVLDPAPRPLAEAAAAHRALCETLAGGAGALWSGTAGEAARAALDELAAAAPEGDPVTPAAFARLIEALLAPREVRGAGETHPRIRIWGTREARVQGADLVILAGLNEGVWPRLPAPDPWMNRAMRHAAGLLVPERQIGLSAHDFQQAIGAPQAILTRAHRDAETETVPSRWLNRLTNLLSGLPDTGGPQALAAMRMRGAHWLAVARAMDAPGPSHVSGRAPRPAPAPPADARPKRLSVTQIRTLIRDPYAIYGSEVLGLSPLNPLRAEADARLRGTMIHRILERFVRERPAGATPEEAQSRLAALTREVLAAEVPWPAARLLWAARIDRATPFLLAVEARLGGVPTVIERGGEVPVAGIVLRARPDRIDRLADGRLHVFDYKTGAPPSKDQIIHFDKQLLLLAAMVERGAFPALGDGAQVSGASYIGLGPTPRATEIEVTPEGLSQAWADLGALLAAWAEPERGFVARRAVEKQEDKGDYDHLARFGEWDRTAKPVVIRVGRPGGCS